MKPPVEAHLCHFLFLMLFHMLIVHKDPSQNGQQQQWTNVLIVLTGGNWKRLFGYLLLLVCFGSSFINL